MGFYVTFFAEGVPNTMTLEALGLRNLGHKLGETGPLRYRRRKLKSKCSPVWLSQELWSGLYSLGEICVAPVIESIASVFVRSHVTPCTMLGFIFRFYVLGPPLCNPLYNVGVCIGTALTL